MGIRPLQECEQLVLVAASTWSVTGIMGAMAPSVVASVCYLFMRQVVGVVTRIWELGPFRSRFLMLLVHEASSRSSYWNLGVRPLLKSLPYATCS